MSRPLKKPFYNKQKITQELLDRIVDAFGVPYDDRDCVGEHKPSIREVAEEFDIAPIRMRKLLITAGVYSTKLSREIVAYIESGMSMEEIGRRTNLSRASVHSYIPYTKTVYKLPERSTDAERTILYRKRQNMVQEFQGKYHFKKKRGWYPGQILHVMNRGACHQRIFSDESDYQGTIGDGKKWLFVCLDILVRQSRLSSID